MTLNPRAFTAWLRDPYLYLRSRRLRLSVLLERSYFELWPHVMAHRALGRDTAIYGYSWGLVAYWLWFDLSVTTW